MTFKHVKFEDSAVMRSLERMAREKGLVPDEPARVKTASAPDLDFPEGSTLMENILKLCAGLRHAGFEKHAQEVEEKFLAFKQAQTLYETSSEKGEDLIDAAHPKGSHKLEDVAGDDLAVVETVIDQHLKHLKMINKEPTGKLANNNQILNAVKVVLADEPAKEVNTGLSQPSIDKIYSLTGKMSEMFNNMQFFSWENDTIVAFNRLNDLINKMISKKLVNNTTISRVVSLIDVLKTELAKETVLGMQTTASKNMLFYVNSLKNFFEDTVREEYASLKDAKPATAPVASPFQDALKHLDSLKEKIEGWLMYGVIRKSPVASKWISEEAAALAKIKETFSKATPAQQVNGLSELQKEIAAEERDINDFESKWIKG